MTEKEILEQLRTVPQLGDLNKTENSFDRVDAYNDKCIVEIKGRASHLNYDSAIIEYDKYDAMKTYNGGKQALYVMNKGESVYIFHLNKLDNDGYDYQWEDRGGMPTTTFWNNQRKSKRVGYITWDKAIKVIQ